MNIDRRRALDRGGDVGQDGAVFEPQRAFDEPAFTDSLVACRLQRHMQALGAYGFLSEVKGKKYFLKHVPEALRLLRGDVAAARQEYPELARLIAAL